MILNFNVCFLQEHKLRQNDLPLLGRNIWREGHFYTMLTQDRLHAAHNNAVPTRKGGLAIGLSTKINALVSRSYLTPCGWALFVHWDDLLNGPMSLLNIYRPNNSIDQIELWRSILQVIDHSYPWLFGGDWNFAEKASGQIGGVLKHLVGEELIVWDTLKDILGLSNIYHPCLDLLSYTWDNHRLPMASSHVPIKILKWLDYFHIIDKILTTYPYQCLQSLEVQVLSNHIPIKFTLC